jgi:hypothetical protein
LSTFPKGIRVEHLSGFMSRRCPAYGVSVFGCRMGFADEPKSKWGRARVEHLLGVVRLHEQTLPGMSREHQVPRHLRTKRKVNFHGNLKREHQVPRNLRTKREVNFHGNFKVNFHDNV